MATPVLDEFLVRHAPSRLTDIPGELAAARAHLREALRLLCAIDEGALEKTWLWRSEEVDVRYGLYRQYEALEEARAQLRPIVARWTGSEPPARPMLAAATGARWDLHGLLAGLSDEDLDRDPGNGEWTVRQTLGHIVGGQRGYNWGSAWWLARRDASADDFPQYIPDHVSEGMPDDEAEAEGSIGDIAARLDDVLDQGSALFAGLDDRDLAVRARWSGIAVDIRFRLGRWASHIREHTVQLEKTLAILERPPSEPARIARLIASAYGRLEADLWMWPTGTAADACAITADRLATVAADAAGVSSAAERAS